MDSNEIESEQSTTELKYLWLFKKIAVRFLAVLSNVYNFAKENSGNFKTTVVSIENAVDVTFGPVYRKLKDLPEQTLVFLDDKFDKYAPDLAKKFVTESQSLIYKTKPFVKTLVTITQAVTTSLITANIFLLQITKYLIQSITQTQSDSQVATPQSPLQNTLDATKSPVPDLANQAPDTAKSVMDHVAQSLVNKNPLLGAVNSAAEKALDATKSPATDPILQKGTDLANQAPTTTKSILGGIPLVGNVAQSLTNNPADLANQIVSTTNSLVKDNPILDAVNSAAENSLDKTNSLVGNIPLVGNVAQSLTTNPADLANQIANTATSLVNENPLVGAINSAAENIGKQPGATGTKAALQSAYMTLKLAAIPVIAQLWYEVVNKYPTVGEISEFILPVVECICVLYNKVVEYMDRKGYDIAGYLPLVPIDEMKAAYKLVKTSRDGLSAVGDLLGVNNNKGLSAVGDILGANKK